MIRSPTFESGLKKLERRHRGTDRKIQEILRKIEADGVPPKADRIPALGGQPVFKLRVPIGKAGTRSGRMIFYRDDTELVALFVYSKAEAKDVPAAEIRGALEAANLLPERHHRRRG